MATVSYVRITTGNGTVLSSDGAAWTQVGGVSFGATQTYTSTAGPAGPP